MVGYFVKPVAAVSAMLGVMTVYGRMVNQFAVLAAENAELDNVALEALLLDDTGRYVTTLANKPRAGKIVEEILLSTGKSMALSTCGPGTGTILPGGVRRADPSGVARHGRQSFDGEIGPSVRVRKPVAKPLLARCESPRLRAAQEATSRRDKWFRC